MEGSSGNRQPRQRRSARSLLMTGVVVAAVVVAAPVAANARQAPAQARAASPTARAFPSSARALLGSKTTHCRTKGSIKTCIKVQVTANNNHHVRLPFRAVHRASAFTQTPPPQCDFTLPIPTPADPDRFTSCYDSLGQLTLTEYINDMPKVTGTFTWENWEWVAYGRSAVDPDWTHGLIVWTGGGTGKLSGGVRAVNVSSSCDSLPQVCTAVQVLGTPGNQAVDFLPASTYEYEWDEYDAGPGINTAGGTTLLNGSLGTLFVSPSPANGLPNSLLAATTVIMDGRCDSIIATATTTHGCVNEMFDPTVTFDSTTNPTVAPVAQHIYDIQTLKIPLCNTAGTCVIEAPGRDGWWPLMRDMNDNDITANRRVACANFVAPPPPDPNTSCDEYPLASSQQGAASQTNAPFSTRGVPPEANSSQGGILSNFYQNNRVIDGDAFFVRAILPDGTPSW